MGQFDELQAFTDTAVCFMLFSKNIFLGRLKASSVMMNGYLNRLILIPIVAPYYSLQLVNLFVFHWIKHFFKKNKKTLSHQQKLLFSCFTFQYVQLL